MYTLQRLSWYACNHIYCWYTALLENDKTKLIHDIAGVTSRRNSWFCFVCFILFFHSKPLLLCKGREIQTANSSENVIFIPAFSLGSKMSHDTSNTSISLPSSPPGLDSGHRKIGLAGSPMSNCHCCQLSTCFSSFFALYNGVRFSEMFEAQGVCQSSIPWHDDSRTASPDRVLRVSNCFVSLPGEMWTNFTLCKSEKDPQDWPPMS